MDTNRIENIAVNAINTEACKYDTLMGNVKKNDKTISLDGSIELYGTKNITSENRLGEIPVQVKGRTVKKFSTATIKHNVKKVDLKNFIQDGKGAIYFIVEILPSHETKIYCHVFTVENTNKILENMKADTKTKSIEFQELKSKELIEKVVEVSNSWKNSNIRIKKINKELKTSVISSNEDIIEQNRINEILIENEVFVETKPFIEAKEKLEKNNIVLLHGEPWVGKTTIANELVKLYNQKGYKFIYGRANEINEIEKKVTLNKGQKIICLVDDFLGSNVNHLKNSELDSCLNDLIKDFRNNHDQKLILTTRTYIYNNAKELFHKFYQCTEIIEEELVDVGDYTKIEKAQILYKHLEKNNLLWTSKYIELLDNKYYKTIITHSNFNPGMIAHICETIDHIDQNKTIAYIDELLKDPKKIWDKEYNKLNFYEQILLNIIALFGYQTPENYIRQQFLANLSEENSTKIEILKLEDEFEKALTTLTISFVKIEFNEEHEKILDTCKHSVRDYIISKIRNSKLDVKKYIANAKYIDMLHYIDLYCDKDEISEEIASKIERDYEELDEHRYGKFSIMYYIFSDHLTFNRQKMVEAKIEDMFKHGDGYEIINLIDNEDNILYPYLLKAFKKYELEDLKEVPYFFDDPYRILLQIDSIYDMENYLKICSQCIKKKNHKFMLERIENIDEVLIGILIDSVLADIKEVIPEYTLELLEEGKTIEEISRQYAKDIIQDEIPSLRSLYTKETYKRIVENLSESCVIEKEELEGLDIDFKKIKREIKKEKISQKGADREKEEKYIQELFEGKQTNKIENKFMQMLANYITHNQKNKNTKSKIYKAIDKWYIAEVFADKEFKKVDFLIQLVENTNVKLENIQSFMSNIFKYIEDKYQISSKQLMQIQKVAYSAFKKGKLGIQNAKLEELLNLPILEHKEEKTYFIFKSIHIYLAMNELIKKEENFFKVIYKFFDVEEDDFLDEMQNIFLIYELIDEEKFKLEVAKPLLEYFVSDMEESNEISKEAITKRYFARTGIDIRLNKESEYIGEIRKVYEPDWILEYIRINLQDQLNLILNKFTGKIFDKYYNKSLKMYEFDLTEMLKNDKVNKKMKEIGLHDIIFDAYNKAKEILKTLV